MKKRDAVIAAVCGLLVAWVMIDFLGKWGFIFLLVFPVLSIFGLWLCGLLSRKYSFIWQTGKFFLTGSGGTVIDIKIFQLTSWLVGFFISASPLIFKTISFFIAACFKFVADKFWTFEKMDKDGIKKEAISFLAVGIVGALFNVISFWIFTGLGIWSEISIILATLVTAIWNFLGYKFLVFKK